MAGYSELTDRDDAAALIPEPVRREIIQGLPAASAALQLMRRVQMSSKRERMPVLSALPNAYWVDGDTGLKQTTSMDWDNKYIVAEEIAAIVPIPDAVLADADYDLWAEIRPRMVEAIGAKLDEAVLFGVDNPFDTSILEEASTAGKVIERETTTYDGTNNDILSDVNAVMALVEESGFGVTGFASRLALRGRLRNLRNVSGDFLYQSSPQEGTPARLYDTPIIYSDANGAWVDQDVELFAGDWSKAILGVRQDITYKLITEGVISDDSGTVILNLAQQDSSALRVVARFGFAVANPLNRRGGDNPLPFAVLGDNPAS
jgi:HK97 family phage major capsid protein